MKSYFDSFSYSRVSRILDSFLKSLENPWFFFEEFGESLIEFLIKLGDSSYQCKKRVILKVMIRAKLRFAN